MATEKQIEANRLNAQKSTGPRTDAGKRKSRLNAVKRWCHIETCQRNVTAPKPPARISRTQHLGRDTSPLPIPNERPVGRQWLPCHDSHRSLSRHHNI